MPNATPPVPLITSVLILVDIALAGKVIKLVFVNVKLDEAVLASMLLLPVLTIEEAPAKVRVKVDKANVLAFVPLNVKIPFT